MRDFNRQIIVRPSPFSQPNHRRCRRRRNSFRNARIVFSDSWSDAIGIYTRIVQSARCCCCSSPSNSCVVGSTYSSSSHEWLDAWDYFCCRNSAGPCAAQLADVVVVIIIIFIILSRAYLEHELSGLSIRPEAHYAESYKFCQLSMAAILSDGAKLRSLEGLHPLPFFPPPPPSSTSQLKPNQLRILFYDRPPPLDRSCDRKLIRGDFGSNGLADRQEGRISGN